MNFPTDFAELLESQPQPSLKNRHANNVITSNSSDSHSIQIVSGNYHDLGIQRLKIPGAADSKKATGSSQSLTGLGFITKNVFRMDRVLCSLEDHLFRASMVTHAKNSREVVDEEKFASEMSKEFERLHELTSRLALDWFWPVFLMWFVIPSVILVLVIISISQLVILWDPQSPDFPYAILFFGTVFGVAGVEGINSKVVLDDLSTGWRSKVIVRWHNIITVAKIGAATICSWLSVDSVTIVVTFTAIEIGYMLALSLWVSLDPPRSVMLMREAEKQK